MTTIPPTQQPVSSLAAGAQAPVTATPVAEVPAQIATLPPNTVIDATVAATAQQAAAQAQARAVVQLVTSLGTLTVRLPMPVPPNATVKLQVLGSGANMQLRVVALNGQPLPGAGLAPTLGEINPLSLPPLTGSLTGTLTGNGLATPAITNPLNTQPTGTPAPAGAANGEMLPMPAADSGLQATVVFGTDSAIPNGTQMTVRLLDIVPPGATLPPLPGAEPGVEPALPSGIPARVPPLPGLPAAPGTASSSDDVTTTTSANGSAAAIAVDASSPSETATSSPANGAANAPSAATVTIDASAPATLTTVPATLPGVVAPNSLGGLPLVQTPIGLVSLSGGPDLQPGSQVTLQTVGQPSPPPPAISAPANQPAQQSGWSNFGETMAVLQKVDPQAAQVLVQRLPDIDSPQFVSNLVTWAAAAQTGDVRAWLGERPVKALEKAGRADLIDKLEDDIDGMRDNTVRLPQLGNDWQALVLPLFFGQRVERVRLMMRRAKGGEDGLKNGSDEEGLRFLLDVDMSQLGALQFDGLVKRQTKHFDLIIRSRLELPDKVQRDINTIFTRSLDGFGMTGGAVFKQTVAFIEPLPIQTAYAGLTI
ncbi:MAG TPA: hypothetical protein VGG27_20115 [Magnetospirillaceae bacterium]|jgi:hypothetical protein